MRTFPVFFPGRFPDIGDEIKSWELSGVIDQLLTALRNASVAFDLYLAAEDLANAATQRDLANAGTPGDAATAQRQPKSAEAIPTDIWELADAQKRATEEACAAGDLPHILRLATTLLHQKTYVYELDNIKNLLTRFYEYVDVAHSDFDRFKERVPGLKDVRDSAHHVEDRAVARRRGTAIFKASEPKIMEIGNSDAGAYTSTSGTGERASVAVTADTLEAARDAIQEAINAIPSWAFPNQPRWEF